MSDLFLRFPRLPHLPEYKTPQNQVDEAATIKKYREDLHRALQEGIATTDTEIGPSSPTTANITATLPVVVTPSPLTSIGVISINDFVASGASHKRGTVPDPGGSAGTTKFLREDATWAVPAGGGSTGYAIVMAKVFGRI